MVDVHGRDNKANMRPSVAARRRKRHDMPMGVFFCLNFSYKKMEWLIIEVITLLEYATIFKESNAQIINYKRKSGQ
jgi:hypothetical protein